MFLVCRVSQLTFILAAVYIPPPFNPIVLRTLLTFQLANPRTPLIIVGDLNGIIYPTLDRYPPPIGGPTRTKPALEKFMEEEGWTDPWRK